MLQASYQERVDPNDKQAQSLLEEMRAHVKKVQHHLRYTVMWHLSRAFPACQNLPNWHVRSWKRCARMKTPGCLSRHQSSKKPRGCSLMASRCTTGTSAHVLPQSLGIVWLSKQYLRILYVTARSAFSLHDSLQPTAGRVSTRTCHDCAS